MVSYPSVAPANESYLPRNVTFDPSSRNDKEALLSGPMERQSSLRDKEVTQLRDQVRSLSRERDDLRRRVSVFF